MPVSLQVWVVKAVRGGHGACLTMRREEDLNQRLNQEGPRKPQPEIEPGGAYGEKGQHNAKVPPDAKLLCEIELVCID